MVEYWNCGESPFPDIEDFVDKNVGLALEEYIEKDGILTVSWWSTPEPLISFAAGPDCEFKKEQSLVELIMEEIGMYRRGGPDEDETDMFFDPEGDRRCILMQELLRTYLNWKLGGVYQPTKDEE